MPSDPKLFREMNVPYQNATEAEKSLAAFFAEVGELRKKHKVPNVYAIISCSILGEDGEEGEIITSFQYGDAGRGEVMTAWALGHEQAVRQERISQMIKQGITRGKKAPDQ